MPSGIVTPWDMSPRPPVHHRPGLILRARVWLKDLELDAALAGGADPGKSEELAFRATQLASRKKRNEMASGINHLIAIADRHSRAAIATPHAPFRPHQVQANRSLLLELEQRLRAHRPTALPGLALTSLMLEDGRGPLTTDNDPATLERAGRAALSALDVSTRPRQDAQPRIGMSA